MVYDQEFRCRRGERCKAAVMAQDLVTGDFLGWVGAELSGRDLPLPRVRGATVDRDPVAGDLGGLCPACVLEIDTAVMQLPMDVLELSALLPRALTGSSAERGEITRPAPGPLLPIQEPIFALQELIAHEVTAWAEIVADAAGEDWDSDLMARTRVPNRVEKACAVLRQHLGRLLALGAQEYMAGDLPDMEVATRRGRAAWIFRDGIEAGLLLLALHRAAWAAGAHDNRPDHLAMPCRNRACHQLAMRHWPGEEEVVCAACGHRFPWADYDVLRSHLIAG